MEEKIKEVNTYFKNKILSKDFKVKEIDNYIIVIIIDDKYEFVIWIANIGIPTSIKCYNNRKSYMDIDFEEFEQKQLYEVLKHFLIKIKEEKIKEEQEKLEKLLKEIDEIK